MSLSKLVIFLITGIFINSCGVKSTVNVVKKTSSGIYEKTTKPVKCFEFSNTEQEIRKLINDSEFDTALDLYREKKEYLDKCSENPQKIIVDLSNSLNSYHELQFNRHLSSISKIKDNLSNWQNYTTIRKRTNDWLLSYENERLFQYYPKYVNSNFKNIKFKLDEINNYYERNALKYFKNFNHFGKGFTKNYPIKLNNISNLFENDFKNIFSQFKQEKLSATESFLKLNLKHFSDSQKKQLKEEYNQKFFYNYGIEEKLNDFKSLSKYNKIITQEYPNFFTKPKLINFTTSSYVISNNYSELDIDLIKFDNLFVDLKIQQKINKNELLKKNEDFILVISKSNENFSSKLKNKKFLSSKYQSGTQILDNPKYFTAQNTYIARQNSHVYAQQRYNQCIYRPCGNQCTLIYSLCAADLLISSTSVDSALSKLNRTSPTIQKKTYTTYNYTETEVTSEKDILFDIYLINNKAKTFKSTTYNYTQQKNHKFVYDLDPRDSNYSKLNNSYDSESDIDLWKISPAKIKIEQIVNKLILEPSKNIDNLNFNKSIEVKNIIKSSSSSSPLTSGVVKVTIPNGSFGSGFYIKSNLIFTNYHVIEGNKFVEIKNDRGEIFQGEVISFDINRDIAAIKTSKLNEIVEIHQGQIIIGEDVLAVGHPKGFEFTVTKGIISSIRNEKFSEYDIESVKYIQTDTPINTGNSGGPLFYKNKLIGMNTMGIDKKISEGLNFALHLDEIISFLNE